MASTPSPDHRGEPAFWLSSRELTAWAPPRACRIVAPADSPSPAPALLVELEPPGPGGEEVIIAPRFSGDELRPEPGALVVVNVFAAQDSAAAPLIAVGELYATPDEAAAPQRAMDRHMFGAT